VLKRGDVMQREDEVTPGALSACTSVPSNLESSPKSAEADRRLALAKWLCDSKNPLTARVIVNRVWQHHFGRGIVGTPSDFGRNGEKPTHPELLDWLASTFTTRSASPPHPLALSPSPGCGWRLKPLHRLLVTSYTY